ncbi:MAG: dihydrofolate synthase/folylpolyglutamate synthase [Pseudohongiellaceae bacterium]|jgi:dihydrofolate synthase/folylpolyglutamate synthase
MKIPANTKATRLTKPAVSKNLVQWLEFISAVHPREIELGLERVASVAKRLDVLKPASTVITVAGTNGKGSTVAALEAMLLAGDKTVGAFTSPHIHLFNERIRIAGKDLADAEICRAFELIELHRDGISLSYFEFSTLAALILFKQAEVDIGVLEVGLGGRLDSVNIVDADIAVITSISLDHQDWLGSDIEVIGFEKAGIMREGKPVVLANSQMPQSILNRARQLNSKVYQLGKEFSFQLEPPPSLCWAWQGTSLTGKAIRKGQFQASQLHYGSVSASMQVLELLNYPLDDEKLNNAVGSLRLAGRFEPRIDLASGASLILDVAHNPAAAADLNSRLEALRDTLPKNARLIGVLAVLSDKDIEGIVVSLLSTVDIWYIAQVEGARRMPVERAMSRLRDACPGTAFTAFNSVESAYAQACSEAASTDQVVVAGSFHTVSCIRELSREP